MKFLTDYQSSNILKPYWLTILIIVLSGVSCSNLPRDPQRTLERVQNGTLRVGLVEHPPWVIRTNGEPAGVEVELIKRFAQEINATPEWYWGSEQQFMEALEHFELDLAAGGINDQTPWSNYVGLIKPYFDEPYFVGSPLAQPITELKGKEVKVKKGEQIAALVKNKGAIPVAVDEFSKTENFAIAAPDWKLEQLAYGKSDYKLLTVRHVFATPPGENGFIKRLEEFLGRQKAEVKNLLQKQEEQAQK